MKVLLLDIDGVLNSNTKCDNGHCAIDFACVGRLNEILRSVPDLVLVVSSDWREWVHAGDMQLSGLEKLLLTHAIACEKRVVGVTRTDRGTPFFPPDDANDFRFRFVQIQEWVKQHEPEMYVVLDDHPVPNLEGHFVRTNGSVGLTDEDVVKVVALFA